MSDYQRRRPLADSLLHLAVLRHSCTWRAAARMLVGWCALTGSSWLTAGPIDTNQPKAEGHWGEDAVGFRWVEEDSRDSRWNQMDTGPMMSSALSVPGPGEQVGMVNKALTIRLGDRSDAAVCFDLQRMTVRCGWTGEFLTYDPTRFGLISPPAIAGQLLFTAPEAPGWGDAAVDYKGLHLHGSRVVLSYEVAGAPVLESYWASKFADSTAIVRSLEIGPCSTTRTVILADANASIAIQGDQQSVQLLRRPGEPVRMRIEASTRPVRIDVWMGRSKEHVEQAAAHNAKLESLGAWLQPGPTRWGEPLVTRGTMGEEDRGFAIDSIAVPFENPYGALMFIGGHDFFSSPTEMAVCTVHGDVWLLRGVDASLERVEWRRFATGLFQPLGLRIVDDKVYVLGRDQITRLHDLNGDGEADFYESFNNDAETSAGGHDYSTCLQTDGAGNFYYVSEKGVHRISADGQQYETIATGIRNSNGFSVGPDGTMTAAPQEGEWTPASAVLEVTDGGYYGFGGPRATSERPLGYDRPLCWIPRLVDNSTGGQAWVPNDGWEPLRGQLLNLSFGQSRILLTLLEPRTWQAPTHWPVLNGISQASYPDSAIASRANYVQGGSFSLPMTFESGVMRARFSPHDGHLYVSGLRGWLTVGTRDGCLQRVRMTDRPVRFPISVRTLANGIALTFGVPLDRERAEDPTNYQLQQWNYKYAAAYGSSTYKISDPQQQGVDDVDVLSATLLDDKTVFLETADMKPVMQLAVRYALKSSDGRPMRDVYYHTVNAVPEVRLDPARLTRRPRAKQLRKELQERLRPGLVWRFLQPKRGVEDVRSGRTAAIYVPADEPATPWLRPGPFRAVADGYLRVPLPGLFTFSIEGRGSVRVRINHEELLLGEGQDLAKALRRTTALKGGYNALEIDYRAPTDGDAALRILWGSDEFATEPLPPSSLSHDAQDESLQTHDRLRMGRRLFAELRCAQCHLSSADARKDKPAMPELLLEGPNLTGIGDRLHEPWIAQWLINPIDHSDEATMPRMFDRTAKGRQQAADVGAFLASLQAEHPTGEALADNAEATAETVQPVERGDVLFEELGCLVCHHLSARSATDDFDRRSLAGVMQKYRDDGLKQFLRAPQRHYPASRMPDFQLSDEEATALSNFIADSVATPAPFDPLPSGDVQRGRIIYESKGCSACHVIDVIPRTKPPRVSSVFARSISSGCTGPSDERAHKGPVYELNSDQREALQAFLERGPESLWHRSRFEAAERLIRRYACAACHNRDGQASQRPHIIAEEGRGLAPELIPDLTWSGEKLQATWTARNLAGDRPRRMRPWLRARMPCFPRFADEIAIGMAHQHGISTKAPEASEFDPDLAEAGRRLTLASALDCRQCHGLGDVLPRGDERTKLAPGINFAEIRQRLHYDSYRRFMFDPPRYDMSVKMPKLSPDLSTTKVTDFFDGDARRQFDAIWHYLQHFDHLRTKLPTDQPDAE